MISAVLSGANDWNEIEEFGHNQLDWLGKYGDFKHGVPAHDTINRVFASINPDEFSLCFHKLTQNISKPIEKEIVAIDGKTICNSVNKLKNMSAIHIVSAYAQKRGITLAQKAVSQKSNEITAIPELLSFLDIENTIVTIDAMGCQKEIAKQIKKKKADYILSVKGNQASLQENIKDTIRFEKPESFDSHTDFGHGRIETRNCSVYNNLTNIENTEAWIGLKTIIKIESERIFKSTGAITRQTRYYISSTEASAEQFNKWIRSHWAIENNLHWMIDVNFKEDYSTKQAANAAQNFNTVSKLALYLLCRFPNGSIKQKRLRAALNQKFRSDLLNF